MGDTDGYYGDIDGSDGEIDISFLDEQTIILFACCAGSAAYIHEQGYIAWCDFFPWSLSSGLG